MKILAKFGLMIIVGTLGTGRAEDVLIHDGPIVLTPDAILYSPQSDQKNGKVLRFKYQFFIDSKYINQLPSGTIDQGHSLVTATKAIDLVFATLKLDSKELAVIRLELMNFQASKSKKIDYYLVTILENRSEIHRLVLMDEAVIKPQMKEMK